MSRQTPHRCLQVHEILDNIFSQIPGEQDLPEHERSWPLHESGTLLSLAVTCKAFTEPALGRLWYHLANLKPLGYILPEQSFSSSNPSRRCFKRLDYYLNKVHIYADDGKVIKYQLHHLFIPAILRARARNCALFPNLKQLHIYLDQFQNFAWLPQAMIAPGIQLLHVMTYRGELYRSSFYGQPSTCRNLTLTISRIGKSLRQLNISTNRKDRRTPFLFPLHTPIPSSLSALRGLESLRIVQVHLSCNLLSHLVSNPILHTLEFTISNEEASEFLSISLMAASKLQTVTLRMRDLELAGQLLSRLCRAGLQELKVIQLDKDHDSWNLHRFFTSSFMSSGGCVKDLQEIELLRKCTAASPEGPAEIVSDTLLPILHIPKLQVLRLSLYGRADLSFEMLERVASACPHLRVFDLHEQTDNHVPELTLLEVVSFASKCKLLEDLRIRFDARRDDYEIADLDGLMRNGPCQTLRILDVCLSPTGRQSQLIFELLFVSFPCLEHLLFGGIYSPTYQDFAELPDHGGTNTHVAWRMIAEDLSRYRERSLRGLMDL